MRINDNDTMTQVKLPHNNSKSTLVKIVLAAAAVLALVATLAWIKNNDNTTAGHPQQLQVRSSAAKPPVKSMDAPPGVHRYEMMLAQLKNDAETDEEARVVIETYDDWAPLGVAHFADLVANQFYDQCRFFRVVDNFVVQFGINGDPAVQAKWRGNVLKDDPVKETNAYGTITYATSGKNTRTVQLFINTNKHGNGGLDKQGFAPIGKIVEGMEFVQRINNEYHEKPNQGMIQRRGNEYLNKEFPRLSYIASVRSLDPAANNAL